MSAKNTPNQFHRQSFDLASFFFSGLTGLATALILGILAVILINVTWHGWEGISLRFIISGTDQDMFDVNKAGVLPMIVGTSARVILMTIFVIPVGVITAIYLTEYANPISVYTRVIRGAVNNLAGVPSIVFGLFGLGFFIGFVGGEMDAHAILGASRFGRLQAKPTGIRVFGILVGDPARGRVGYRRQPAQVVRPRGLDPAGVQFVAQHGA